MAVRKLHAARGPVFRRDFELLHLLLLLLLLSFNRTRFFQQSLQPVSWKSSRRSDEFQSRKSRPKPLRSLINSQSMYKAYLEFDQRLRAENGNKKKKGSEEVSQSVAVMAAYPSKVVATMISHTRYGSD